MNATPTQPTTDMEKLHQMGRNDPEQFMNHPMVRLCMATIPKWLMQQPIAVVISIIEHPTACPKNLVDSFVSTTFYAPDFSGCRRQKKRSQRRTNAALYQTCCCRPSFNCTTQKTSAFLGNEALKRQVFRCSRTDCTKHKQSSNPSSIGPRPFHHKGSSCRCMEQIHSAYK